MTKQLSVYLDLLRFLAAVTVFVSHTPHFAGGWLWQLAGLGHEAVVFFFVLSGFVIAFVVYEKQEDLFEYAVNRLARIYSVALPALLLAIFLYFAGHMVNAQAFEVLDARLIDPYLTTAAALLFLNQSWIDVPVFSNLPYWSLGYEVLYYVAFAILVYANGMHRWFLLLCMAAVMGFSVLIYLPIWLMGVYCFKNLIKRQVAKTTTLVFFIASVVGIVLLSTASIRHAIDTTVQTVIGETFHGFLLETAQHFGSDYILAVFVTMHIFASYKISQYRDIFGPSITRKIRSYAASTFSLYLYHMPLLFFIAAIFPHEAHPVANMILCWLGVPCVILLLSRYTEKRKDSYKEFFATALSAVLLKKPQLTSTVDTNSSRKRA